MWPRAWRISDNDNSPGYPFSVSPCWAGCGCFDSEGNFFLFCVSAKIVCLGLNLLLLRWKIVVVVVFFLSVFCPATCTRLERMY